MLKRKKIEKLTMFGHLMSVTVDVITKVIFHFIMSSSLCLFV